MVTDKIKELKETQAKMAELEKSIATQLAKELAALPGKYGFETVAAFIKAVKASAGGKRKAASPRKPSAPRRKRAVITAETKTQVKSLHDSGKTAAEIGKEVGISQPSVQNIKKELGLVKARK